MAVLKTKMKNIGKNTDRRTWIVVAIIVLIFLLILYIYHNNKPFLYAGTLEVTKVNISSRLSAAIDQVRYYEGDKVKAGDVLVTFVGEDFRVAAQLAKENYDRYNKLVKPGYTTPENIDQLSTAMKDANIRVNWLNLTSPLDATVLERVHEPGEWMSPGTRILTLGNIKDIWAYIYVPQPSVAKLSYGMKLRGYIPELNNRMFEGKIIKINEEAEFTPKNVQTQSERERLIYGVKVSFLDVNQEEILKPGMTIEVELPK